MATEFGQRLKAAYKHAGLTQVDLAKAAGISQASVSEACQVASGSSYTVQFALSCGVDPLWLATGKGSMMPSTPSALALDIARQFDAQSPAQQEKLYALFTQLLKFAADTQPVSASAKSPRGEHVPAL